MSENQENKKAEGTGLADGVDNLVGSASRLVMKAANILEEEIARGIIAAKEIESKFTNIDKLRKIPNDELLARFRTDAHEIIDLMIDVASVAIKSIGNMSSQFIKVSRIRTSGASDASVREAQITLIQMPGQLRERETGQLDIDLENDDPQETKSIEFENTALTDTSSNQLPAATIEYIPNPLVLAPASSGTVKVKAVIPVGAKPGTYSCMIQAKGMPTIKATLMLTII